MAFTDLHPFSSPGAIMALTHVTFFFVQGTQQWAEQLYRDDPSFTVSVTKALQLANARYSILGAGALLTRIRVTQLGAPKNSVSRHVSGSQPSTPAVLASIAALLQLSARGQRPHSRPYWLHGLPVGAWAQIGGVVQFAAPWIGPVYDWLGMLVNNGWLVKGTVQVGPSYPIVSLVPSQFPPEPTPITAAADWRPLHPAVGLVAYLLDAPTMLPSTQDRFADAIVRIARTKWFPPPPANGPQVNGEFPLFGVQGTAVSAQAQAVPPGGYASGGTLTFTQNGFLPINGWTFVRIGEHKVGPARSSNAASGSEPMPLLGLPSFVAVPPRPGLPQPAAAAGAIAPYSSPPGTVPVPPPPVVPPPTPPPPPGPFLPESMDPRPVTLTTLLDVGTWLRQYCGFYGYPAYNPIGIAKVTNLERTWVVMLYGQKLEVLGTDPGILTSVAAGIAAPTAYENAVLRAMDPLIPAGDNVLLYGYSLGGMICELIWSRFAKVWNILGIVTLGSPVTCLSFFSEPISRFATFDDQIPNLTPLGLFATLTLLGPALYSIVPKDPNVVGAIQGHIQFCTNPGLARWNAWGQLIPGVGPTLELDALRMFSAS